MIRKKILLITICIISLVVGYLLHKEGVPNNLLQYYLNREQLTWFQRWKYADIHKLAQDVEIDKLNINFSKKNWSDILEQRDLALEVGYYYSDHQRFSGYQPCTITHNGIKYRAEARLKGLMPDHYADPNNLSLKVKLKGDSTILGMNKFSIQAPQNRGGLNEWYLHQFLKHHGLIWLIYDFVEVKINGNGAKVMAIEENMRSTILARNELPDGPLFTFATPGGLYRPIEMYESGKVDSTDEKFEQFLQASEMLELWRNDLLSTGDVFDVEMLATFFAIIDLMGHHHATSLDNCKFYFNPVTKKIAPIGYDNQTIFYLPEQGLIGFNKNITFNKAAHFKQANYTNNPYYEQAFNDTVFFKGYITALKRISNKTWLDELVSEENPIAREAEMKIQKTYPAYSFKEKEQLLENQDFIKCYLSDSIQLSSSHYRNGDSLVLEIENLSRLPLVLAIVKAGNKSYGFNEIIQSKSRFQNNQKQLVSIPYTITTDELIISYHLLGSAEIKEHKSNLNVVYQRLLDIRSKYQI